MESWWSQQLRCAGVSNSGTKELFILYLREVSLSRTPGRSGREPTAAVGAAGPGCCCGCLPPRLFLCGTYDSTGRGVFFHANYLPTFLPFQLLQTISIGLRMILKCLQHTLTSANYLELHAIIPEILREIFNGR